MTRPCIRAVVWSSALVIALLLVLGLPHFYQYLAAELIIWALLALSLDLLIGYTGLPSFGQAVFFGVPAYAYALVVLHHGSIVLAVVTAVVALAVVAIAVAYLATATGGVGFIIVTLLASFSVFLIMLAWTSFTGGENGLYVPRAASLAPLPVAVQLIVVALIGIIVWWVCRKVVGSGYGLVLRGIKSNERRLQALGYDTERIKFQITLVSAGVAGIAGILFALVDRTLSVDLVGPELSTEVVIWVLLGGAQTLLGPMLGAALFVTLKQTLNTFNSYPLVLGILFIIVVTWAPSGLLSLRLPRGVWRWVLLAGRSKTGEGLQ
jgi:branched-chain amino acid transport system permease protein